MGQAGNAPDWTARFAGLSQLASDIKARLRAESHVAMTPNGDLRTRRAPENLLFLQGV